MSNRKDYYFRQPVTEAELDAGFADMEDADRAIMSDQDLVGVFQNGVVTEVLTPDLTVDVSGPCLAYDQLGRRVQFSPDQNVDCSIDEIGNPTAVGTPGNEKWLSLFLEFDRVLSDPRIDGNSATVFFERGETFQLNIAQGAEAVIASAVRPPLRSDQVLLADIRLINGQTAILNADIDLTTRRQDVFVLTGTPNSEREGTVKNVLQAFQDQINAFINGGAAALDYAGGPAWHDGTTNPGPVTIEAQLDKIITDLVANAGADRIGADTGPAWHDATAIAAGSVEDRLDQITTDLIANEGADRIGVAATPGGIVTAAGSIQDALAELETDIQAGAAGQYPLPLVPSVGLGAWALVTTLGASDYPRWEQTGASASKLFIPVYPVPGHPGSQITAVSVQIESATTDDITIELYSYDPFSGQTRTLIGGPASGSGFGGNAPVTIGSLTVDQTPGGNVSYMIEVNTSGAGGGLRKVTGASVTID